MGLSRGEWRFGLLVASAHGGQHVFYRLLPPLIPVLVLVFGLPLWQFGSLVGIYAFAGGLFQAPMGIFADRYDRRLLLPPGYALMGAGYLTVAASGMLGGALPEMNVLGYDFSGTFLVMALGMFVGGTGFSVVHPVGYPLISANVAASNKGTVLGFWGSASKFGDAAAPLLVGLLVLALSWDQILALFGVGGLLYAAVLFVALGSSRIDTRPEANRDLPGGEAAEPADDDVTSGAAEGSAWARREFVVPMALILLFFFAVTFAGQGINTFTPVYLIDVYGFSVEVAGVTLGPESVANLYFSVLLISGGLVQLVVGPLTDRLDHRAVLLGLLGLSTVGLLTLVLAPLTPVTLMVSVIVVGCGLYGLNPARDALISDIAPPEYEGRTFGYLWTLVMFASAVYPVAIGYLADTVGIRASFGYLVIGTVLAGGFVAALYSDRLYRPATGADDPGVAGEGAADDD